MSKYIYTYISLTILSVSTLCAQYIAPQDRFKEEAKPFSHDRYQDMFDSNNSTLYFLESNPAMRQVLGEQDSLTHALYGVYNVLNDNSATLGYRNSKTSGDYLYYEGNELSEFNVYAIGQNRYDGKGTLFGTAFYSNGVRKGVTNSYVDNFMDYFPYNVSDLEGDADQRFERYEINGGYAFALRSWLMGFEISYEGCVTSTRSNPKLANYNSTLGIKLGAAKEFYRGVLSLSLRPTFNWQTISVSDNRQGGSKYHLYYGLGQWNRMESGAGNNYERFMTYNGFSVNSGYVSSANYNNLNYGANISYAYRAMNTLEQSNKNLFSSYSNYLRAEATINKRWRYAAINVLAAYQLSSRSGAEHLYKNTLVDPDKNLYDYVKISTSENYKLDLQTYTLLSTILLGGEKSGTFAIKGGVEYDEYYESYSSPNQYIRNQDLSPIIGVGYSRNRLMMNVGFSRRFALDNSIKLANVDDEIADVQIYTPFQIRGEESYKVSADVEYSHPVRKRVHIGARLSGGYLCRVQNSNGLRNELMANATFFCNF